MKKQFFLFYILISGNLFAQQSISFQKIKNPGRVIIYNLPAMVTLSTKSHTKYHGILTSYTDSTITIHIGSKHHGHDSASYEKLSKIRKDHSLSKEQRKTMCKLVFCPDSLTIAYRTVHKLRLSIVDLKHGTAKVAAAGILLTISVFTLIGVSASYNISPGYIILEIAGFNLITWPVMHRYISPGKWNLKR